MDVFDLVAKIVLNTSDYEKGLEDASEKTSGFGGKIKGFLSSAAKIGATALGAATTAVTAFGASSVKTGMAFDSSMSQVAATMGTTVDKIQDLRDFAMDMGANTAFSATQAADALNYMALAGYNSEQAMTALPNVLNLAAAGGIELAAASDMVTDAQSALGLTMDESAQLVDKMAMASSKSNTSVAQLGEAILTVGGTAKNLAGGTTELSTSLGILADNGVKGAEGGTALRNIILSLSAPTDTAAAAMQRLGLEVFDAEGKMRPLNETFGDLEAALSTMTQGEQTQVLSEIFNKVDLKSVNALLANSGERFDELSGYIDNAKDSAARMAAVQLDNLEGDITLFKSAMEGAQIVISDGLTPTLREFTQFGTNAISTLSTAFQEGGLSGAMNALGTLLGDGLGMIAAQLPKMIDAGKELVQSFISGIQQNRSTLADSAVEIGVSLLSGIGAITGDILLAGVDIIVALAESIAQQAPQLIPAAVAALAQFTQELTLRAGSLLASGLELIGALAQGVMDAVPVLIESVPQIMAGFMAGITAHAPDILYAGYTILTSLGQGITENVSLLAEYVPQLLNSLLSGITTYLPNLLEGAQQIVSGLAQGIAETVPILADTAITLVQSLGQFLSENLPLLVESALQMVMTLAQGILDSLPSLVDAAIQIVASLVETIWNTDWIKIGSDILQFIVDGIAAILGSLLDIAIQLVDTLLNTIGEINWFQVGADVLNFIINGIASLLGSLLSLAGQLVSTVWDKITTTDWWGLGKELLNKVVTGIRDIIPNLLSAAGSVVQTVWDKVTGTDWLKLGSDLLNKFISGIKNVFSNLGSAATELVDKIKNTIKNTNWLGVGRDIISGIANGIGNAAGMLIQAAQNVAASALNAIKSFFGIASPSKLMAKEVGRWLPPGIGAGIEQAMPQLNSNVKKQMQGVVDTAGSVISAIDVMRGSDRISSSVSHVSKGEAMAYQGERSLRNSVGSGVVVNQNIYAAEQSPVELAANTRAAFQRARWAIT